jgi:hypothetical protein
MNKEKTPAVVPVTMGENQNKGKAAACDSCTGCGTTCKHTAPEKV